MDCEEMIYSNDYADYVINSLDLIIEGNENNCCTNPIMERIAIQHCPQKEQRLTNLESVPYSFIPKLYGLMDSTNMEVTGVKQAQEIGNLGLSGRGVIVAVIDTGIDYTNNLFIDENGNSRVGIIWDQTIPSGKMEDKQGMRDVVNDNNVVSGDDDADKELLVRPWFGTVYSNGQINEALNSENPYNIVNSRDDDGHGTFMAGIAAGGRSPENDFTGIAYASEIAVVKLKEAKPYLKEYFGVKQEVRAYQETDIIYAVDFLIKYASRRKMPISIYIGVGSSNGGHLGYTFLERYLDSVLENIAIMISVPTGNEGNTRLHYAGSIPENADYETIDVNIAEGQTSLTMELWGDAPNTFAIGIDSPRGERIERITPRFGTEELFGFPITRTSIYVAYQLVEVYSGDELIFIRINNPTPGIWRFYVYADDGRQRTFNIWMPLRQFLEQDTYFLRPEPENTVTNPGNSRLAITMTAYNHITGSLYAAAGRGYTARTVVKPSLTAPGVNITGPGLRNNFTTRTGTSVAAAHSSGMLALFLEWNLANQEFGFFFAEQIASFFFRSAEREISYEYPNIFWGYGIMNIWDVFERFRIVDIPKVHKGVERI